MDPPNPYSQRSNFMDLLSSQEETPFPQNIPYGSFSQTVGTGLSEIPIFSTQSSDDKDSGEEKGKEGVRRRWKPSEDLVLISSWLNTSKDAVISNEQKSSAFWKRIAKMYAESPTIVAGNERPFNQCKQRWRKINEGVRKFCGAYAAAERIKKSGHAPKDYLKLAHEIYFNDYKAKFTLEHAWNELKTEQKWCSLVDLISEDNGEGSSKRRKSESAPTQSDTSQSVTSEGYESMVRPAGIKASKAKLKKTVTKTSTEEDEKKLLKYQRMWEIKEKDYDRQERLAEKENKLSNKKLLENLLAKTEPLSDIDNLLKNKLINELFS